MSILVDPSGCAQKIIDVHGQTGVAWLARLPMLLADAAARWSLTVLPPFPELSYNYVAPVVGPDGAALVLKAGVPHSELWDEMEALRLFDGRGIARLVAAREKELAAVDDDIDTGVRSSPAWLAREELLVSVPGIGPVIARTLISEIPELGSLDRRSVASLAGLAPFTRQSGQWKGKSMIAAGRAPVRAALFIAVMVASRFNPTIKAFHQRLRDAGKPKMVALIACARKLLTILNAILRDQKPWQNA